MNVVQDWPHQRLGVEETIRRIEAGVRALCLSSPTGGGKSRMVLRLIEWAVAKGWQVAVFTNRKMLTSQLSSGLLRDGIKLGVRAAEFEAYTDIDAPVQVCSTPTELHRVYKAREKFGREVKLFPAQLILIDEVHLNKADSMMAIVKEYRELYDSRIVGISATPLGVSHFLDELIVAGNNTELRDCGALIWAKPYEPAVVDLPKIRRSKSGFDSQKAMEDSMKAIWTQHVVGHIWTHWKQKRPEGKSCLGMAPGVKESLGLAHEFYKHGINAAHFDAETIFVDGKEYNTKDQTDRDEVLLRSKAGEVPMIWNRFVLREAVDMPWLEMLTLATPISSVLSYVQTVGRILRASPSTGKQHAIIVDHANSIRMHGGPNLDRDDDWRKYFHQDEEQLSKDRVARLRDPDDAEAEPLTCPQCGRMRAKGNECPECHFIATKSTRKVIQEDGELKLVSGNAFPKRVPKMKPDTSRLVEACYFRCANARKPMTFNQMRALFKYENHYWPPMDLPFFPKNKSDMTRKIKQVPRSDLHPKQETSNA